MFASRVLAGDWPPGFAMLARSSQRVTLLHHLAAGDVPSRLAAVDHRQASTMYKARPSRWASRHDLSVSGSLICECPCHLFVDMCAAAVRTPRPNSSASRVPG